MKEPMKPFEIIRDLRKTTRLKHKHIADFLNMSRSNYGNKENGKVSFSADEIFQVLKHLKPQVSEDAYLKAVMALLESQDDELENQVKTTQAAPTPINEITQIIQEVFEEEGQEMNPELVKKCFRRALDLIKTGENGTGESAIKNDDEMDRRLYNVTKQFRFREMACQANERLADIEGKNVEAFLAVLNEINRVSKCIEQGVDPYPVGNSSDRKIPMGK